MLVLSVPVLTRSPSRLQFLIAIATRLPFWPGRADLKRRVTLFSLDWPSEYQQSFRNLLRPSGAHMNMSILSRKHPHNEGMCICKLISTHQMCTGQHCWSGITSNVIFVGGVNFFYSSVAEGQFSHPVHASPYACGQT